MDEKTLKRLLRADATTADRQGWRCPDDAQLAAFVERRLPDEKRSQVEAHLADCEACLGQVAFLARETAGLPAPVVPGAVARARDLVGPAPSRWRPLVLRWGAASAGVACIAAAAALVLRSPSGPVVSDRSPISDGTSALSAPASREGGNTAPEARSRGPEAGSRKPEAGNLKPPAVPSPPAVRRSAPAVIAPSVVVPAENATLSRRELEFRWHAVPGSLYYEINVVTDDGSSVWRSRVGGTSARPPEGAKLDAGAKYFVWVKAFLSGGETVKSAAVSFHTAGQ